MSQAVFVSGLTHGDLLAFPLTLVLGVVVGLLDAGSMARRRVAVALAMLSFLPPFFVSPEHSAVRLLTAMATVMVVLRSIDLCVDGRPWSAARRVWLMVSIWDSRRASFAAPALDGRALVRVLGFATTALVVGIGLREVSTLALGQPRLLLRWLLGAAFVYVMFDALHALMIGLHRACGVVVPPFHRDPILSRSVGEFWGTRWNMIIHDVLSRHLFRPLVRRRRPWLGVAASFVCSGLLHAWLMFAALGVDAALRMGAYFLVQGVLFAVERPLGVLRWRSAIRRTWTVVAVLGPSPLFTEPLITTLGF